MKKAKSQRVFIDDGKPHPYARFLLRLVDVGLLGVYFLFFSIIFAIGVEKLYNPLFGDNPSNTGVLVLEIALYAATVHCICCRTTMINAKDFVAGHIAVSYTHLTLPTKA